MSSDYSKKEFERHKNRSISRELIFFLVMTVVVVSAIVISFTLFNMSQKAKARLDDQADESITTITKILALPLWNVNEVNIKRIGVAYAQNELVARLRITDKFGMVYFNISKEHGASLVVRKAQIFYKDKLVGHVEIALTSEHYKELNRNLLRTNIITILTTLLALIVTTGLMLRVFLRKPLVYLNRIVNSYASGKYDSSEHHTPFIEFQPFVAVLGEMGDKIKSQVMELQKSHNELERRVKDRTSELVRANKQLVQEIDERQKAEEQLKVLVDDLDCSNTELQDFAYIVSHDLKAPLRGISSLASWISEDYAEILDEKGQEQIEKLLIRTDRMHNLIEGILQLSRIGRVDVNFEPLQTEDIVRETIENLSVPENINSGIKGTLPSVIYDRTLLIQLFQNLIGNAVKHLDKPAGDVVVSCNDAGEFFEFCVQDNGLGIEERHFERIFKMFQSLKPRSKVESTGIGLALVKKIVERCGGTVRVKSAVGKGSAFYFTIPKASDSTIK